MSDSILVKKRHRVAQLKNIRPNQRVQIFGVVLMAEPYGYFKVSIRAVFKNKINIA